MIAKMFAFILFMTLSLPVFAQVDARMAIPSVQQCVLIVKSMLNTVEYYKREQEKDVIVACRNADPKCVDAVLKPLSPLERTNLVQVLPLVKACEGIDKGLCYLELISRLNSLNYNEAVEAKALLRKCD